MAIQELFGKSSEKSNAIIKDNKTDTTDSAENINLENQKNHPLKRGRKKGKENFDNWDKASYEEEFDNQELPETFKNKGGEISYLVSEKKIKKIKIIPEKNNF